MQHIVHYILRTRSIFYNKKKWYGAAVFAGIATLFQVLVGLHLAVVIGILYVFTYRSHIKASTLLNYYVVYLLVSVSMLFPMLFLQEQVHSPQDNALYYHILYYVRNPNHHLPSAFPRQDYIHFIALSSVAFALHFFVNERLKNAGAGSCSCSLEAW